MEPLFASKTTNNENLFYHQVMASKKKEPVTKKKFPAFLQDIRFSDILLGVVAFGVFFMTMTGMETAEKAAQSLFVAIVFVFVMKQMNRRKRQTVDSDSTETADRRQAQMLLENSCREGEVCDVRFDEECFQVKYPGIVTEYQYEGVSWIKETSEFYIIFWNQSMVIPVEKAGFYRGRPEQFHGFLEKKCQKTIEIVMKPA